MMSDIYLNKEYTDFNSIPAVDLPILSPHIANVLTKEYNSFQLEGRHILLDISLIFGIT